MSVCVTFGAPLLFPNSVGLFSNGLVFVGHCFFSFFFQNSAYAHNSRGEELPLHKEKPHPWEDGVFRASQHGESEGPSAQLTLGQFFGSLNGRRATPVFATRHRPRWRALRPTDPRVH
jgi:hypothetical protein